LYHLNPTGAVSAPRRTTELKIKEAATIRLYCFHVKTAPQSLPKRKTRARWRRKKHHGEVYVASSPPAIKRESATYHAPKKMHNVLLLTKKVPMK